MSLLFELLAGILVGAGTPQKDYDEPHELNEMERNDVPDRERREMLERERRNQ